jgi:hypothetical protein
MQPVPMVRGVGQPVNANNERGVENQKINHAKCGFCRANSVASKSHMMDPCRRYVGPHPVAFDLAAVQSAL